MSRLSELENVVKRRKRVASEWAMLLHDLAEERLPDEYAELPALADGVYRACEPWRAACRALVEARS